MCRWAEVSAVRVLRVAGPAGRRRPRERRRELAVLVAVVFEDSDGTYGYRRVHAAAGPPGSPGQPGAGAGDDARAGPGGRASRGRSGRPPPSPATQRRHPDLVARDFTADAPGTKLVGDITYIPTWRGLALPGHR